MGETLPVNRLAVVAAAAGVVMAVEFGSSRSNCVNKHKIFTIISLVSSSI
jgi:hypothetical protein